MSFATVVEAMARNVGVPEPDVILGSSDRTVQEMVQFINEAGQEIARRVDWGHLNRSTTLNGDGTNKVHALPADFARLVRGICVTHNGSPVRSLSQAEWAALTPVEGQPRYFLLEGQQITFWPFLAAGLNVTADIATVTADQSDATADGLLPTDTVDLSYQSLYWTPGAKEFVSSLDEPLISEELLLLCAIVRYRRQKGMDYADFEAEYEAAIGDLATFDDRSRL